MAGLGVPVNAKALAERLRAVPLKRVGGSERFAYADSWWEIDWNDVATEALAWFREQRPTQPQIEDLLWNHFRRDKQTVATIQFAATAILALWDAKEQG